MGHTKKFACATILLLCYIPYSWQDDKVSNQPVGDNAPHESLFSFDDAILYKINWLEGSPLNHSADSTVDKDGGEEIIISSANKEQYRCIIPNVDKKSQLESELSRELDPNPYQLLKPIFTKKLCSYRVENYWTYEICHGKYIRQFHEDNRGKKENEMHVQEYYLGKFDSDSLPKLTQNYEVNEKGKKRPVVNVEDLQLPYIEVNMTDGTLCDLSNKKRLTRVLYVCVEEGNHDLYSIKETSTCEYEVISFSPLLCKSSEFKLKNPTENEIKCYPMNAQSPTVPHGFQLNDIQNEIKAQKSIKEALKNPGTLFEGKTILIDNDNFGKGLRISIVPEPEVGVNSKISQQFLSGEYCLTGGSGWWKYEFCYGRKVDQFHQEKNGKKVSINLGNWDLKEHIKWIEGNPSKRPKPGKTPKQVSHFYSYGEACDLTKKPRTVEVKLKCPNSNAPSESVTIYLMEPRTCEYVLGVESVIICDLLSTVDEYGLFQAPTSAESDDSE